MQAMKGATTALGSMNRSMNLPALQRIAMEFERENDVMEQRQEMMDDAIDDAMDVGEEEEGEEVVEQVLEEIGIDLNSAVRQLDRMETHYETDQRGSSARPPRACSQAQYRNNELRKPLAAKAAWAEAGRTMIYRHDLTVSGGEGSLCIGGASQQRVNGSHELAGGVLEYEDCARLHFSWRFACCACAERTDIQLSFCLASSGIFKIASGIVVAQSSVIPHRVLSRRVYRWTAPMM